MVSARGGDARPGATALAFTVSLAIAPLMLSAVSAAAQTTGPARAQAPAQALPASAQAQKTSPARGQSTAPATPQVPDLAAVKTAPAKDHNPLGATVYSKDGRLAGAVDQFAGDKLVVGLAGYLGQGAKDVAIPAKGLHVTVSLQRPRHFAGAQYGGGNITRVTVPMTLSQLVEAPGYKQQSAQAGKPSPHVGTPAESKKKPPSSTQSGGPG